MGIELSRVVYVKRIQDGPGPMWWIDKDSCEPSPAKVEDAWVVGDRMSYDVGLYYQRFDPLASADYVFLNEWRT